MSIFDPRTWFRKENPAIRGILGYQTNTVRWSRVDYTSLAREGYSKNVYVFACIQKLAMACSSIRPVLWRVGRGGLRTEITDPQNEILKLIKRPNPRQGYSRYIENEISNLMLSGNSFIAKAGPKNNTGKPKELYILRSDRVRVVAGTPEQPISGYQYMGVSGKIDIAEPTILHIKTFNPLDDFYGMAPLEAGARSVDQNNESRAWNVALLQNGARPTGAIISKDFIPEEPYKRLQERFLEKSGPMNAGAPLVLEGQEISWQELGLTPIDMAWLEGSKLSAREIAIVFGVPPEIVGDSANKTYANYGEARLAMTEETVIPLMDWRTDEYNNWLIPQFGDGFELGYDKDSIEVLREKRAIYIQMATVGWNSGFLKRNEARRIAGEEDDLDPESGDAYKPSGGPLPQTDSSTADAQDGEPSKPVPEKMKFFHLQTQARKSAHWSKMDRMRIREAGKQRSKIAALFDDEMLAVVKAVRGAAPGREVVRAIDAIDEKRWKKLLETLYFQVGHTFARQVWKDVKSQVRPEKIKTTDDVLTVWEDAVQAWLDDNAADKVTSITDTTRDSLRSLIKDDMDLGKSVGEIADDIEDLYGETFSAARADMIARTETISASNLGSQEAAKATGLNLEKEWIATGDDRTRDEHKSAEGQRVKIDDAYTLDDGSKLMFPGDSGLGADASQTINCRCSEGYYSVDEEN